MIYVWKEKLFSAISLDPPPQDDAAQSQNHNRPDLPNADGELEDLDPNCFLTPLYPHYGLQHVLAWTFVHLNLFFRTFSVISGFIFCRQLMVKINISLYLICIRRLNMVKITF